jgi:uncharacterized membrane protein
MQSLLYFFGHGFCHQLPSRSFAVDGLVFSVCSRDTGIYLGLSLAIVVALLLHARIKEKPSGLPSLPILLICGLLVLPMALDAVSSYLGLRQTTNAIRYVTGVLAGAGLGTLVAPLLFDLTRLSRPDRRIYASGLSFSIHLALTLLLATLFYFGFPFLGLLAPLIPVVAFLGIVCALNLLVLSLFERLAPDGRWQRWLLLIVLALGMALVEIALLGLLRDLLLSLISSASPQVL